MGILSRFADIIASNINALLDKAEDPAKMADQYLMDAMEDLAQVKDEMFAAVFEKAGDRIMSVTRSPVPFVILAVVVLLIIILAFKCLIIILAFKWWTKAKEQRNREAEERERILNADINSVEDPKLKDLEEKYKDDKA